MAHSLVATVKVGGVRDVKMAHEFGQIGFGRLHDQVKVVGHQDVGMKADLIDFQGALELLQECFTVRIIAEDCSSFIAAAGDVIEGVGIIDPERSCHGKRATTAEG